MKWMLNGDTLAFEAIFRRYETVWYHTPRYINSMIWKDVRGLSEAYFKPPSSLVYDNRAVALQVTHNLAIDKQAQEV